MSVPGPPVRQGELRRLHRSLRGSHGAGKRGAGWVRLGGIHERLKMPDNSCIRDWDGGGAVGWEC